MNYRFEARGLLTILITGVAVLATVWAASMLIGGFVTSGQLDSPSNPLGPYIAYVAAAAMIGATATFYFALGFRERNTKWLLIASGAIVLFLTLFSGLTQTFMVVDAALGPSFVRVADAKLAGAMERAARIDQAMTDLYQGQIAFQAARLNEENTSGRGPRYRAAEAALQTMRATYGSALGRPALPAGTKIDLAGFASALDALSGKAAVLNRFAAETGIAAPDFAEQIKKLAGAVEGLSEATQTDRRTLVYQQVIVKLGDMLASYGMADLGFSLSVLLALCPDLIQILCTILLLLIRRASNEDLFENHYPPVEYWDAPKD